MRAARRVLCACLIITVVPCGPVMPAPAGQKSEKTVLEATVVDLSAVKSLSQIIPLLKDHRVIFIGESHTSFGSHDVQLEVIKGLSSRGKKIGIGMEMFQRPFQNALDRYIAGTTDEPAFLRESEYFSRWGFNYHLYKPIIDFARSEKIPVIALNARKELVDKVAKGGITTLSPSEREEIPKEMDLTDNEYRERLKEVFKEHTALAPLSFDDFYQAQVAWDETMAETAASWLKENPDRTMVVLAGSGHIAFGSGIPKRLFRRSNIPYRIVLTNGETEKGIGDYIVYPPAREGDKTPQLGVMLKDRDGGVVVQGFSPHGNARDAGLLEGDEILAIDKQAVGKAGELRIMLFFRKPGDTVDITVKRRFLFWDREIVIPVVLK